MPSKWRQVKLADCASFQEGYVNPSQKNPEYFDGPIKWLRVADLNDDFVTNTTRTLSEEGYRSAGKSALLFKPGTLAISKSGTIGRVGILLDYMCGNRAVINITVDKSVAEGRFVFYVLKKNRSYFENMATGSVQKNLYTSVLGSLPLRLPPLPEQKAIAHMLGTLDDKIELNRQMNATLESMAQALFKSWFVDFDPVIDNALAAGNPIPEPLQARADRRAALGDKRKPLPEAIREQFPSSFVFTEEMGWVPEGWSIKPLSDFGKIICGKTPSKSRADYFGADVPFIKIPDMHTSMFVVEPVERLTHLGAQSQAKKMLQRGSVCVSCIATVGKVVITTQKSQTNQQINTIVPINVHLTPYLYFYMLSLEKHFHDLASGGSTTLNMNTSTFSKIGILDPGQQASSAFYGQVGALFEKIEYSLNESISLMKLRDTLLPKLLSGQIRVPDAEKQLAEAI